MLMIAFKRFYLTQTELRTKGTTNDKSYYSQRIVRNTQNPTEEKERENRSMVFENEVAPLKSVPSFSCSPDSGSTSRMLDLKNLYWIKLIEVPRGNEKLTSHQSIKERKKKKLTPRTHSQR